MASFLINTYNIPWLSLQIGKPGAVHNAQTVGVSIERGKMPR
jgi:dihydroneopterin aldolase